MTITLTKRKKQPPKYYVYFDDWTGDIISVGQRPRMQDDSSIGCLITDSLEAQQISYGEISDDDYLVRSTDGVYEIKHKSECVIMRSTSNSLFLLPRIPSLTWDISVRLYSKNMKMVFRLSDSIISRLAAYTTRQTDITAQDDTFEFYIIPNARPDYIITCIKIKLSDLRRSGFVVVDVADIEKYVAPNKFSIMTRRQFTQYYFDEVVDDEFITMHDDVTNQSTSNWQVSKKDYDKVHVEITQLGNKLLVNNMVSTTQLDTIGLTAGIMQLYVIGKTPDDFIDMLTIDITKLREGKMHTHVVDYDLADVTFIHKDPYFKVGKRLIHDTNK
jgi:hypothetical protein